MSQKSIDTTNPAIYWDLSLIWGILLVRALKSLSIPFYLLSSEDIASGKLNYNSPSSLFVPGGWAAKKCELLGQKGKNEILSYIAKGGRYLGICGGAGLGLSSLEKEKSLNICPWYRKKFQDRLVNCSGHMLVKLHFKNKESQEELISAPVWWPSQFSAQFSEKIYILASYVRPEKDFWIADLPATSLDKTKINSWEKLYQINLNPDYLKNEPCVIMGNYKKGTYLLTYLHPETPSSEQANNWFKQLLAEFCSIEPQLNNDTYQIPEWHLRKPKTIWKDNELISGYVSLHNLVKLGQENFLLNWRKAWLLGWRRSIPGFVLNNLLALNVFAMESNPTESSHRFWSKNKNKFSQLLQKFCTSYAEYLLQERFMLTKSSSIPNSSGSERLRPLKEIITGPFPGQGGLFGQLAAILEKLIYLQLKT